MANSKNDIEKHIELTEAYFKSVTDTDDLDSLKVTDVIKALATRMHGLNGGHVDAIPDAMDVVGFDGDQLVMTDPVSVAVMVMIEFSGGLPNVRTMGTA